MITDVLGIGTNISTIRNTNPVGKGYLNLTNPYAGIEFAQEVVPYDETPTELKRQIEASITNRRGYLSIQQSLSRLNSQGFSLNLRDAINAGHVPVNVEEDRHIKTDTLYTENPCGEIPLGEPSFFVHPAIPQHTQEETTYEKLRRKAVRSKRDDFMFRYVVIF